MEMALALLITGFSTGTTTVAYGVLPTYFDKYYNISVSILSCGMSFGMIVMPLITQLFRDIYGWRGAMLLLCGITFHSICCGALFKPVDQTYGLLSQSNFSKEAEDTRGTRISQLRNITRSLDIDLFFNSTFLAIMSIYLGNGYATTGWLIYIVPHALDLGFSPYEASMVATLGGIGNLVGNCLLPLLGKLLSNQVQLYSSVTVISCSFVLDYVASYFFSYFGVVTCSIIYGLARGIMTSSCYAILVDVLDENQMINAIGWLYAGYGFSSLLSGFVCGWLFDQTGSYGLTFLVLGAVCGVSLFPKCVDDLRRKPG
ncbi:monocarboxylate transporter 12-like [Amphiura filiformis]|uniref:monocarboxylate transporter 12-like n=1 Tax=Amphiura filiformis TaxID=82378 RepID=UPI003B21DBAA